MTTKSSKKPSSKPAKYSPPKVDYLMLTCAIRYCLGRHTYVVGCAEEWIKKFWGELKEGERAVIRRDIQQQIEMEERPPVVANSITDIDLRVWKNLLVWIDAYV